MRIFAGILALCFALMAAPAYASWDYEYDLKTDAQAACVGGIASTGPEVAPTYGCADFQESDPNHPTTIGYFLSHLPNGYHVYYYREEAPNECENKPDLMGIVKPELDGGNICVSSCAYYLSEGMSGTNGAGESASIGTFKSANTSCEPNSNQNFEPAGDPDPSNPDNEECIASGSLSSCWNPEKEKICAVTPRGSKACWSPNENTPKISPDQKESLSKTEAPTVAPAPPTLINADTQEIKTTTTSPPASPVTIVNNITYANTTGVTGTGTSGSGSSGDATGEDPTSGSGEPGDVGGNGHVVVDNTVSTTSPGHDSAGNCTVDCSNAGTAGSSLTSGELYSASEDTYASVFATYKTSVEESPIISAAETFLTVEVTPGACPVMELAPMPPYLPDGLSYSAHCSGAFLLALQGSGFILLALAAYGAFKIAVL